MASQRARARNNVKAGAMTLICLLLFVAAVIAFGELHELIRPKKRYVVEFPMALGTQGVSTGSAVEVGGQPVGRVSNIERFLEQGEDGKGIIAVTIAVDRDLKVYRDAEVELRRPLLGAGAAINFSYLGSPSAADPEGVGPLLRPELGQRLRGHLAPGFLAELGFTREDVEATRQTLANLEHLSDRMSAISADVEDQLPSRLAEIERILDGVAAIIEQTRQRWPEWMERLEGVIARAETIAANAESFSRGADEGVADARALIRSVQSELDVAAPKVQSALDNIDSGTAILKDDLIALIDEARRGLDGYVALGEQLSRFRSLQQPSIERMLANARLASEQLKLTAQEVRRAPWRLLHKPSQRETREELLYDAARSYAQAANDLWAASEALRVHEEHRLTGHEESDESARALFSQMEQALASYQQIEAEFVELLRDQN